MRLLCKRQLQIHFKGDAIGHLGTLEATINRREKLEKSCPALCSVTVWHHKGHCGSELFSQGLLWCLSFPLPSLSS